MALDDGDSPPLPAATTIAAGTGAGEGGCARAASENGIISVGRETSTGASTTCSSSSSSGSSISEDDDNEGKTTPSAKAVKQQQSNIKVAEAQQPPDEGSGGGRRPKRRCTSKTQSYRFTVARVRACGSCVLARSKCEGGMPCQRCFKYSLRCRFPTAADGQFSKDGGGGSSTDNPSSGDGAGGGKESIVEVVVRRSDPEAMAQIYMQEFSRAQREGLVDRGQALMVLRMWHARSIMAGTDITFGLAGTIGKKLDIKPMELEGPGAAFEAPENIRKARLQEAFQQTFVAQESLKRSAAFRREDDGVAAICMHVISKLGRLVVATNERHDMLFRSAQDILFDFNVNKSLSALNFASLITPEDRSPYFQGVVRMLCARTKVMRSTIFKMVDKADERPRLFIFFAKQEILEDGSTRVTQRIELAPRSRHIHDVPKSMCVVKAFRQIRSSEDEAAAISPSMMSSARAAENMIKDENGNNNNNYNNAPPPIMPSIACVFPAGSNSNGSGGGGGGTGNGIGVAGGAETRWLPSPTDIFKPVDVTRLTAPPPCPNIRPVTPSSVALAVRRSSSASSNSTTPSSSSASSSSTSTNTIRRAKKVTTKKPSAPHTGIKRPSAVSTKLLKEESTSSSASSVVTSEVQEDWEEGQGDMDISLESLDLLLDDDLVLDL